MIEVTVKTLDGKNRAFSVPDEVSKAFFFGRMIDLTVKCKFRTS